MSDAVLYEHRDGIGFITLNRGDNRNSMTPELLADFSDRLAEARADVEARAIVITGKGSCFSAGADFKSNLQGVASDRLPSERSYAMYEPFLRVLDVEVPVIAAMNGHAVGGGFGLSLLCDLRIANRDAKLGANFAKLGLHPGMAISYLLPRLVGMERASELLFTGRLLRGSEAHEIGLVLDAVPGDQVQSRSLELARSIADAAPLMVRTTKRTLRQLAGLDVRGAARFEALAQAESIVTADAAEGMSALLSKRPPNFTGKP